LFDENNDNIITFSEFFLVLKNLGDNPNEKELLFLEKRMQSIGSDKGEISFN